MHVVCVHKFIAADRRGAAHYWILVVVTRAQTSTELCIVVVSNQNLFRDVVNFMT